MAEDKENIEKQEFDSSLSFGLYAEFLNSVYDLFSKSSIKEKYEIEQLSEKLYQVEPGYVFTICDEDGGFIAVIGVVILEFQDIDKSKKIFSKRVPSGAYGILVDSQFTFYVYKNTDGSVSELAKTNDFAQVENLLTGKASVKQFKAKTIKDFLRNNSKLKTFADFVEYNEDDDDCEFKSAVEENLFWETLIKDDTEKEIETEPVCKYTTLETLYHMINNDSIRVSCIVGMNDNTEVNYFDSYCGYNKESNLDANSVFITCCTKRIDDLTMWRLYGDNSSGVCLIFDIVKDWETNFMLHKVSYENYRRKNDALEIVKTLLEKGLVFKEIDKWKHYFKPYDYRDEQEIRLLFINGERITRNVNWVLTGDTNILNPTIDFSLKGDAFPFKLRGIILGNNCPEKGVNISQIRHILKKKNYDIQADNVRESTIKNYRK